MKLLLYSIIIFQLMLLELNVDDPTPPAVSLLSSQLYFVNEGDVSASDSSSARVRTPDSTVSSTRAGPGEAEGSSSDCLIWSCEDGRVCDWL